MEAPALTTTDDQLVVGDIPALRPGFQPRPALMAQLNRASQRPPVVLTGIWGAGKTQLAAAYARARLAGSWRLIAWVNARNSETLQAGLAAVAEAAGLSAGGSRPGPAGAGQAIRDWLEADGSFRLLVFDDVEDPGLLRPFVPAAGEARVLITAAGEPRAELGTTVRVNVFGRGRRTGPSTAGAGSGRGGDRRAAPKLRGVPGETAGVAGWGSPGRGGGWGGAALPAWCGGGSDAVR